MSGIENTKEVLDLVSEIGVQVATALKRGGFQPKELLTIFEQPAVLERLHKAVHGITAVPSELRDLDPLEIFVLSRHALEGAEQIVAVLRSA